MKKILLVFGTRPEAIKLAPVFHELRKHPSLDVKTCVTAQHREMLDQVLELFQIVPDYDLNIMGKGQTLEEITSKALLGVSKVLHDFAADGVIVHGDTTTTMAASLAAFYQKIPVFHVEAGLRTNDIYSPWPEEANRRVTDSLSTLYFAPTSDAQSNLLNEGVAAEKIIVTGNTVIDALQQVSARIESDDLLNKRVSVKFSMLNFANKIVLITGHRRENFGEPFKNFCSAIATLASKYPAVQFVYPVHLNPNVRRPVNEILNDTSNVFLLEPLEYIDFVYLMKKAYFIITDSGGIQEEAPSFSVPVLITRDKTERPEAIRAGIAKLVGTNPATIVSAASQLLADSSAYSAMQGVTNPFGDGRASERILAAILNYHGIAMSKTPNNKGGEVHVRETT